MRIRPTQSEPWDDDRLAAAFAARATRAATPGDLAGATSAALRTRPSSSLAWRRLLAPAAVVILAVGAVSGGIALVGEQHGSSGVVEFVEGPSADVKTLDAQEFAFEYPADWLGYDSFAPGPELSSVAVLATVPVEARCGDERHVDIRCVNERPLHPGEIRMNVSTGTALNWSFADRPDIGNGTTRHLQVAGRPAILDVDAGGNDYYGADQSLHLYVERPVEGTEFVMVDLISRDHPAAAIEAVMQQVIRTFWIEDAAIPASTDPWAGREAIGLRIMSVYDAIPIRDAGDHDREIAVHGWFSEIGPMSCPYTAATSPVQPVCPDQFTVLMAEPESLMTREANGGFSGREPAGPAIQIDLDDLDGTWRPGLPDPGPAIPVEIVVVGHFDDRRSTACPVDLEAACRDRFVVDRVQVVNGEEQPTSLVDLAAGPGKPFDEVQRVIDVVRPDVAILSAVHVEGSDLGRVEPILADRRGGLVQEPAVWVVRALDLGALATYLFVDATDDLYEITPDDAVLITPVTGAETSPTPSPSSPAPPATTVLGVPVISVPELVARRAAGLSPDEVAVSGWIASSNVVYDCNIGLDPRHPLVPFCDTPIFLMERFEQPDGVNTAGPSVAVIIGPDANVDVPVTWGTPLEVFAIGHLDDGRWPTCPTTTQLACRREFVVDRIVAAEGSGDELPEPWRHPSDSASDPATDPDLVIHRLESRVGEITILSLGFADSEVLREIEPFLRERDRVDASFKLQPLWIVRGLVAVGPDPTVSRTFLVTDGPVNDAAISIWEVGEGRVAPVRESAATP
jgi:hypothetical protein